MAQDFVTRNSRLGQETFCLCPASAERAELICYLHTVIRHYSITSFSQAMSDSKPQFKYVQEFQWLHLPEKNLHLTSEDMEV